MSLPGPREGDGAGKGPGDRAVAGAGVPAVPPSSAAAGVTAAPAAGSARAQVPAFGRHPAAGGVPAAGAGSALARVRVAVLISGRGSNMASLLTAAAAPDYPAEVVLVLSNRPDAAGLDHARACGIEALCVDHRPHGRDRAAHEAAIHAALQARGIGLVCLAGYMRLLTPLLVGAWAGRMLNIHPSLLPAFPGLDTHARALAAGCRLHGCTVHLVTAEMDAGPILAQAAVPVLADDTPDILAARVLRQEHRLYPIALRLAAERSAGRSDPDASLLNPLPSASLTPALPGPAAGT